MMRLGRTATTALTILGLAIPITLVIAQEFGTFQGSPARTGRHQGDVVSEHPGRTNLRWWDPLFSFNTVVDNWEPGASWQPQNDWRVPPDAIQAFFTYVSDGATFGTEEYRYAVAVPSRSTEEPTQPASGQTLRTFTWALPNTAPGQEYALSVNLPIGPTDDDPSNATRLVYPIRYYVFEVLGAENPDSPGNPIVIIVDNLAIGGGEARLGGERVFTVDAGGVLRVRLLNTIVRDGQNNLTEDANEVSAGSRVVYADAVIAVRAVGQAGTIVGTPVVGELQVNPGAFPWRVVSARNEESTIQVGGEVRNYTQGIVTSFTADGENVEPGNILGRRNMVWSWPARRLFADSAAEANRYSIEKRDFVLGSGTAVPPIRTDTIVDKDNASTDVSGDDQGWAVTPAVPGSNKGVDYLTAPSGSAVHCTFSPKLSEGDYEVLVWLPNNVGNLATSVRYEIYEGGMPGNSAPTAVATINQRTAGSGWVRLVSDPPYRRTRFTNSSQNTLKVRINVQMSQGGTVYADMVRFRKSADLRVTSTPVMTTARVAISGGGIQDRDVVLVAMENGKIYCLDARGNENTGRTTVYWVYPSERVGPDPNHVAGLDGPDGISENPIGFDLSSAIVQRVPVGGGQFEDLLYIYGRNGRVYCLEMAGRGDYSATQYGTTRRRWSYPDDYPTAPVDSALQTNLGDGVGSLSYAETPAGPTIFVPASQGRVYAVDAVGDATAKTTTTRWTYPLLTDPTLGSVTMTPLAEFDAVFFGSSNGRFYAVEQGTGQLRWEFTGSTLPFGASSPCSAPAAVLGGNAPVDTVFVANRGPSVFALNAQSGAQVWTTDEIASASGSLAFSYMSTFSGIGFGRENRPVVLVPTVAGNFVGLFARAEHTNISGTRRAWQYNAESSNVVSSFAVGGPDTGGFNWLYAADSLGYLYAFNDNPSFISAGTPPGQQTLVENDPTLAQMRAWAQQTKVRFVSPSDYEDLSTRLRAGTLTHAEVQTITGGQNERITRRHFEYGETIYMAVFDCPYPRTLQSPFDTMGVTVQYNTPGASSQRRTISIQRVLSAPQEQDGIALVAFPMLGVGSNALAPGTGSAETSLALQGRSGASVRVESRTFNLANPMGLRVRFSNSLTETIGFTTDAADPEVEFNGNNIGSTGNPKTLRSSLGATHQFPGNPVSHGQTSVAWIEAYDRSLMRLLLGDRGLSNVRVATSDLGWQGQQGSVYKPLGAPFVDYEDLPELIPNISIDYPDLRRDSLRFVKEAFGSVENPLFTGITLRPPTFTQGALDTYRTAAGYNAQLTRTLAATDIEVFCEVPKFQPPNALGPGGNFRGYAGLQYIYVDSNTNGRLSRGAEPPEAYRETYLAADVAVDERLEITTPTVDLGSLPGGAGFSPLAPWDPASPLNPWNPNSALSFSNLFQRFRVLNEGNVNMLNVRLVKGSDQRSGFGRNFTPIALYGAGNHPLAWFDAGAQQPNNTIVPLHLHSDIDPRFAPVGGRAILQKPRPGDLEGTSLSPNPKRRSNENLGVTEGYPLADSTLFPPGDPKVGVTVPVGAPIGTYITKILLAEDRDANLSLSQDDPTIDGLPSGFNALVYEPHAEPGLTLRFTVRETRLTTSNTIRAAAMMDRLAITKPSPPAPPNTPLDFYWSNQQPAVMRDGFGNVIVAFASNRLTNSNAPGWLARLRDENDPAGNDQWRVYVGSLNGSGPQNNGAGLGLSSLNDLNAFAPDQPDRWFRQGPGPYPTWPEGLLWGLANGEQIEPGTANYGVPAFASSGPFDPLVAINSEGRPALIRAWLVFMGEAVKRTARGERVREQRLFISPVTLSANGRPIIGRPSSMRFDAPSRKSKPSMVTTNNASTVFYAMEAAGLTQIAYSHFRQGNNDPGQVQFWSPTRTLALNNAFESVGAPSVTLRRLRNTNDAVIDFFFTGKLRGRETSEAFMGRLRADSLGRPTGRDPQMGYPTRVQTLEQAGATGVYWLGGVDWRLRSGVANLTQDVTNIDIVDEAQRGQLNSRPYRAGDEYIDVFRLDGGTIRTILDHRTLRLDRQTGILSYETVLGGRVYIDTGNGSVRFAGALIPRNSRIMVRYTPTIVRVSAGARENYRGATHVFDERFIGDTSYWATANNTAIQPTDLVRNDRFVLTYARTSVDGSQTARPYMRTVRFGVELPTGVLTNADGTLANFRVLPSPAVQFYQVDPVAGRVYFQSEAEDATVTVEYSGVDEAGVPLPAPNLITFTGRVGPVAEMAESAIPIEQVANESSVALALDPMNLAFNRADFRRPGLLWLIWSSTRGGSPDLYFQSIAPRLDPRAPNR